MYILVDIRNGDIFISLQANEHANRGNLWKKKSNDLRNNIFSAQIEISNLHKRIEGIVCLNSCFFFFRGGGESEGEGMIEFIYLFIYRILQTLSRD